MIYLLDTNTCIRFLTNRSIGVLAKFRTVPRREIAMCDVVKAELFHGAWKSQRREENLRIYRQFCDQYFSLPFDGRAAETFGQVKANLERRGLIIGAYDLQIASIALANDLVLVTHNVKEFSRVDGLHWTDWE